MTPNDPGRTRTKDPETPVDLAQRSFALRDLIGAMTVRGENTASHVDRYWKLLESLAERVLDEVKAQTEVPSPLASNARDELLGLPLEELGLTPSTIKCLRQTRGRASACPRVETLGDLVGRSEAELRSVRGLGAARLGDVKMVLTKLGLSLRRGRG